jgi:hypothetical protein
VYIRGPVKDIIGKFMSAFEEFPPSQKAGSFTIEQTSEMLDGALSGSLH